MGWEVAIVSGFVGMAVIFTIISLYFYDKAKWLSILFFMMLMLMLASLVQFNSYLIDINEQANSTIVGQTTNTTIWNNLRTINQTWYSPMVYLSLIFGFIFVILLFVDIFKYLMGARDNKIKDMEEVDFDGTREK